ncbi:hypothetical protein TNIN_252931 [Trichonephila inaurata madagascariensis]|uniref:Uncharacterized protein n=1 Tax=Trichonephila inaurata madagascariensis TaxID=2747483 RepID=A0A8X6XP55_9ARAC|nr:hypothetical protein TNIN_252931 [Trichonephila inaurata madagascariensis]
MPPRGREVGHPDLDPRLLFDKSCIICGESQIPQAYLKIYRDEYFLPCTLLSGIHREDECVIFLFGIGSITPLLLLPSIRKELRRRASSTMDGRTLAPGIVRDSVLSDDHFRNTGIHAV